MLTRLESAELEKVRDSFTSETERTPEGIYTPPPQLRALVPREDEEDPSDAAPPSQHNSSDREIPSSPVPGSRGSPMPRANTALGLGAKTHPSDTAHRSASAPEAAISRPPGSKGGRWQDEAPSGPRSRKPLAVDTVGDVATRIARGTRPAAPKIVASQSVIASAPIDSRSAFVLSLVDGSSDVAAIVDATGMPEDEVIGILARLARLGLITVP